MIQKGVRDNKITFTTRYDTLAAAIGEYWFYICKDTGKTEKDFTQDELADMVYEAVNSEPINNKDEEQAAECLYYKAVLEENMHKSVNSAELTEKIAKKLQLDRDCTNGLYEELSQIPDGYIKDALSALVDAGIKPKTQKYAACISSGCVRDAQYSVKPDSDHMDDSLWLDSCGWPLFVKIIEADTQEHAAQAAAAYADVDEGVIELVPIK